MNTLWKLRSFTRSYKNLRFYCTKDFSGLESYGQYEDLFPDTSTPEIKALLQKSPQCVYAGFDPTAESLHVGNLLVLMNLLRWQRHGHQIIILLGGATGLIGDPSHRNSERVQMEGLVIRENLSSILGNIETIFGNHKKFLSKPKHHLKQPIIVNNIEWYRNMNVIPFIRDIGKYFRMGTMLGRSSVQSRLKSDSGMSFTEFTYAVFQAYDWLELLNKYNCRFQIGGNDQMGNIVSGYDLITRKANKKVYGMTLPLITAEGGKKFGKSLGNAVWLSPSKSSSFQFYQFFVRSRDDDVEKYLKYFTFFSNQRISEIIAEHFRAPERRFAQKTLAEQVTLLVHGEEGLEAARKTSAALYEGSAESLSKLKANELVTVFEGAEITDVICEPGITVHELAMKAKCFKTTDDANRIINAGGFHVNHQKITNTREVIVPGIHILPNNVTLIRVGKKTYHIVRWM